MTTTAKELQQSGSNGEAKTRAPKRPAFILIKESIDKLSNVDLKQISEYCDQVKKTRKAKVEAEAKELE